MVKAAQERRVVLTHDLDFGTLLAFSQARLPSVIIFRLTNMTPANVNVYLDNLIAENSTSFEVGVICIITEVRVRIRHLPI